jgi:hypothetical protein
VLRSGWVAAMGPFAYAEPAKAGLEGQLARKKVGAYSFSMHAEAPGHSRVVGENKSPAQALVRLLEQHRRGRGARDPRGSRGPQAGQAAAGRARAARGTPPRAPPSPRRSKRVSGMAGVTLDTGALIALERRDWRTATG